MVQLIKEFEQPSLLRSHQLGVADYVDKDIGDFEFDLPFSLCGHEGEFYSGTSAGLYIMLYPTCRPS